MSDKTYVLSLSADTFNAFKMDFDSALQRLLQKMDRLQSDSASINCKISVALTPAPERNFDATREGDTVQVMKPSFSHEISTEIKVKDKTTGNLSGNRKLVWDEELMEYVMKDIDDGQTSLFDTAQSRQNAASPVEQEPPQLPEGIVDVDYTVISDDKGYILAGEDMSTNIPGVFGAGDINHKPYRQITTAVSDGTIAALAAERWLRSRKK